MSGRTPLLPLGLLAASALLFAACAVEDERRVAELPDQLELPEGSLFSVDTRTPQVQVPVLGGEGVFVSGLLSDSSGRRSLELAGGSFSGEPIREAGWVVLSAGAQSGETLCVCWSELSGSPSTLTVGELPDPTDGVDLLCRFRTSAGWSAVLDAAPEATAAWVQDVTVTDDGFQLRYRRDSGYLVLDTQPEDGSYTVRLVPGEVPGLSTRVPGSDDSSAGGEQ